MQHTTIPVSELLTLLVHPELARINKDNTQMMSIIDDELHILVGDFTGIETETDLENIIKRNL